MLFLYTVLLVCCAFLLVAGIVEQRRHFTNLDHIPTRVLVNGIRGKSSITRLCAGALRGGGLTTVAKTTGTAARFIHPDATEEPVYRKFGIANVVEQIGIVRRAAAYKPDALVIECMAVMPALQEINQSKLIRSTIGVLCNVREDHLAEMGPTLDDVARSLCRSMPEGGICVTAEKDRFDILQEEADSRDCKLIYADPETVTDEELRGFSWFTFKENVAIALTVAELLGVDRETALQGMYDAPPDPGVLSVERYITPENKKLRFANVFAANDPESTLMNINQLLDLGAIHRPLNVVINCRPDRVERNGQMGEIIPELDPEHVFVIGHPAKSAIDAIPGEFRSRAVDLGGDKRDPEEFMAKLLQRLGPVSSLVAIGNIHGQGEHLLEHLAELPADETPDEPAAAAAPARAAAAPAAVPEHVETMQLYAPRIDPYRPYSEAYEARYAQQPHARRLPAQRDAAQQRYPQQQPTGHATDGRPYPQQQPTGHAAQDRPYPQQQPTDHATQDRSYPQQQQPTDQGARGRSYPQQQPTDHAARDRSYPQQPTGQVADGRPYPRQQPTDHAADDRSYAQQQPTGQVADGRPYPRQQPTDHAADDRSYPQQQPTGHAADGRPYPRQQPTDHAADDRSYPQQQPTGHAADDRSYAQQQPTGHAADGRPYPQQPTGHAAQGRPYPPDSRTQPYHGDPHTPAEPEDPAGGWDRPRGLFEPRVQPPHSADDQWHSPGEHR